MDSIILAIILCQIHVQAIENIILLDDQIINSEQVHVHVVVSLIFTNYRSFKIGAVVSGQHYFGYCTLSDICAGS